MSKPSVWVVWSPDGDLDNVKTLVYGDGSTRVYPKDEYDGRIDLGRTEKTPIPYFRYRTAAVAFLVANPGKECQVDTRTGLFED
jgi:hypothetical protein